MECYGTQNSAVEWESILETSNLEYNAIGNQEALLAVNWPEGSPYTE
jgi:hypothetical protein